MDTDLSKGIPLVPGMDKAYISNKIFSDLNQYPKAPSEKEFSIIREIFFSNLIDANESSYSVHYGARSALSCIFFALKKININSIWTTMPYWSGYDSLCNMFDIELVSNVNSDKARNTSAALVCFPNNPDGERSIDKLKHTLDKFDMVVIDAVYIGFLSYTEYKNFISVLENRSNYILIVSVSKFISAPNLRIAYTICNNHQFLSQVKKIQNTFTNTPSYLNRMIALDLLKDRNRIKKTKAYYESISKKINSLKNKYDIKFISFGMFLWVEPTYLSPKEIYSVIKSKLHLVGSIECNHGVRWLLKHDINYETILKTIQEAENAKKQAVIMQL